MVGGATAFTRVLGESGEALRVLPRQGNGIYWSNQKEVLLPVASTIRTGDGKRMVLDIDDGGDRRADATVAVKVPSAASIHTGEALATPGDSQQPWGCGGAAGGGAAADEECATAGAAAGEERAALGDAGGGEGAAVRYKYALNVWVVDEPFDFAAIQAGNHHAAAQKNNNGGDDEPIPAKFRLDLGDLDISHATTGGGGVVGGGP